MKSPAHRMAILLAKAKTNRLRSEQAKAYRGWGRSMIRAAGKTFRGRARRQENKAHRIRRRHGLI